MTNVDFNEFRVERDGAEIYLHRDIGAGDTETVQLFPAMADMIELALERLKARQVSEETRQKLAKRLHHQSLLCEKIYEPFNPDIEYFKEKWLQMADTAIHMLVTAPQKKDQDNG